MSNPFDLSQTVLLPVFIKSTPAPLYKNKACFTVFRQRTLLMLRHIACVDIFSKKKPSSQIKRRRR